MTLVKHLSEFNRKERFFLVGMALGNTQFTLSQSFRAALGQVLGLNVPEHAFAAMDYHLDWLAASLHLAGNQGGTGPHRRVPRVMTATQEDIDLLVAYEDGQGCHLVMVEAKGVTSYSNRQFRSKVKRLSLMFDGRAARASQAIPHFVLVSPRRSQRLKYNGCAPWMLDPEGEVRWLQMPLPAKLKRVVRCKEDGTISRHGDYWKVVSERSLGF